MKKLFVFIGACLMISVSTAQDVSDTVESLTPDSALFVVKTCTVKKLVEANNAFIGILPDEQRQEFQKNILDFKNKTGIDLMNADSLANAGIDVEKSLGLAYFKKNKVGQDQILVHIPVKNEKTAPLRFVEILKNANKDKKDFDIYPATTGYRGVTMYQVRKDVFFAAQGGYLSVSSTGEIVKNVIDIKADNRNKISNDSLYLDYMTKIYRNYEINLFMRREFIREIMKSGVKKEEAPARTEEGANAPGFFGDFSLRYAADNAPKAGAADDLAFLNAVEYFSGALGYGKDKVRFNISANFNRSHEMIQMYLNTVKTGIASKALLAEDTATYVFFSLDLNYLEKNCGKLEGGCAGFDDIKKGFAQEFGADFSKDFLPNFSGAATILFPKTAPNDMKTTYVVFLSMNDQAKTRAFWEKARAFLGKKFKGTRKYGEENIGQQKAFWYINDKNEKNYIAADARGLYIGSSAVVVGLALGKNLVSQAKPGSELAARMGKNMYFLTIVKKESMINSLLMMQAQQKVGKAEGLAGSIGDVYIISEKNDQTISVDLDIQIVKAKAPAKAKK